MFLNNQRKLQFMSIIISKYIYRISYKLVKLESLHCIFPLISLENFILIILSNYQYFGKLPFMKVVKKSKLKFKNYLIISFKNKKLLEQLKMFVYYIFYTWEESQFFFFNLFLKYLKIDGCWNITGRLFRILKCSIY